ncbi:hypothetical protein JYB64_19630 [Algoriphagus aestuarii]|nr:hypothetical protein [Algoriphagus aestuarii]
MRRNFKKILLTIGLFSFLAILPISCDLACNDSCGCGPSSPVKDFKILSFEMLTLDHNGQEINPTDFRTIDQVVKIFGVQNFEMLSNLASTNMGIPGLAFACSPLPPKSAEALDDIKIFNTKEVEFGDGTVLKIGNILNEYFTISPYFSSEAKSIDEFLKEDQPIFLNEYFQLKFTKNPQKQTIINFSMEITLDSGRRLSLNDQFLYIE